MTKLDAKFYGQIRKVKDDTVVPDDEHMTFLAKDNAFALVLPVYLEICKALGADQEHLDAAARAIVRVNLWRSLNRKLCKVPDAKGDKLLA